MLVRYLFYFDHKHILNSKNLVSDPVFLTFLTLQTIKPVNKATMTGIGKELLLATVPLKTVGVCFH
jgi:hypothetical protein